MPTTLFRVEAQDHETAVQHTVYVRADSAPGAIAHVNRKGLTVRAVHRAEERELPSGTVAEDAYPGPGAAARRPAESRLLTHPISTIALGVFLGMCLFTVVSYIIARMMQ